MPHLDEEIEPEKTASPGRGSTSINDSASSGRLKIWALVGLITLVATIAGWRVIAGSGASQAEVGGDTPSAGADAHDAGREASRPVDPDHSAVEPPPDEVELEEVPVEQLADRPELAGYRLFIAHAQGLVRFDTDTGDVTEYGRAEMAGSLVDRYRDQLIFVEDGHRMTAAGAEDPVDTKRLLFELDSSAVTEARVINDNNHLAVTAWHHVGPEHYQFVVDLESVEVIDRSASDWWRSGDVTWVPGGGLFELGDGEYRHIADGFPIVVGTRYVLSRGCDSPERCENRWIDRMTGEQVDRAVPDGENWYMQPVDDHDRLVLVDFDDQATGHRYFDTVHGWYLPSNVTRGTAGAFVHHPPEDVIGDGRYLLTPTVSGLVIYDLDTHSATLLDFDPITLRGVTGVVAVPKPTRWGASR